MGARQLLTQHEKGKIVEQACATFLKKNNILIISSNFYSKMGEIDLIGIEKDMLIFFEIRYRQHHHYGNPIESVTVEKQNRIYKTSLIFLMKNPKFKHYQYRFDIIGTYTYNDELIFNWQKNAFQPRMMF